MGYFLVRKNSSLLIYDRRLFIRLEATNLKYVKKHISHSSFNSFQISSWATRNAARRVSSEKWRSISSSNNNNKQRLQQEQHRRLLKGLERSFFNCFKTCIPSFTDCAKSRSSVLIQIATKKVQWPILNNSHAYHFCKTTHNGQY